MNNKSGQPDGTLILGPGILSNCICGIIGTVL